MRLLIIDHFANAIKSLRSNRTRTLLTGLGIAVGVASITAILALSAGFINIIDRQIDALQNNIAIVRPMTQQEGALNTIQPAAANTLSLSDYESIRDIEGVTNVAPLMIINGQTKKKDRSINSTIVASTPDLQKIASLDVRDGQFLDDITNKQTAVIGQQLSVDLFGTDQSMGQTFTVRGTSFTVIGILKARDDPINFNAVDFNSAAIVHLEAGQQLRGGSTSLQQIDFQADNPASLQTVIKRADTILGFARKGEKDYSIIAGSDIAKPTSALFTIVQQVVIAVAGISLLVGGIGVMNIMLVNVAERTREIGLRKAIGASNGHIIAQFLIESILIGLVGGIIGYGLGYLAAFAISTLLPFTPIFAWSILAASAGISMGIGLIFGLYPAIKAARKDPIESLRYYQ